MEKVYLLLRKNQQTGPYTYEELLQQQLLPTDLIWVEGKSTSWMNPEEVKQFVTVGATVKPASPEAAGRAGRKISSKNAPDLTPWYLKRKSPEAELEERALALRERAQAAAAEQTYRPAPSRHAPSRRHMVYQEEESPILLEVHTINKKSVTLPQLIAAGVITALVAAGWYNREVLNIVRPQQNAITQAAAPAVFQVSLPAPPKPAIVPVTDTATALPQDAIQATTQLTTASIPRSAQARKEVAQVEETTVNAAQTVAVPAVTPPSATEKKEEMSAKTVETAPPVAEKKEETKDKTVDTSTDKQVDQATTNKKKGLGQALKNIFKKKKKNEEKQVEDKEDVE
jgi:hypothetical protein